MNKVAARVLAKIEALKNVNGPKIALIVQATQDDGIQYQGQIEEWSQDLLDENRLIDFENTIDSIYNVGIWE